MTKKLWVPVASLEHYYSKDFYAGRMIWSSERNRVVVYEPNPSLFLYEPVSKLHVLLRKRRVAELFAHMPEGERGFHLFRAEQVEGEVFSRPLICVRHMEGQVKAFRANDVIRSPKENVLRKLFLSLAIRDPENGYRTVSAGVKIIVSDRNEFLIAYPDWPVVICNRGGDVTYTQPEAQYLLGTWPTRAPLSTVSHAYSQTSSP